MALLSSFLNADSVFPTPSCSIYSTIETKAVPIHSVQFIHLLPSWHIHSWFQNLPDSYNPLLLLPVLPIYKKLLPVPTTFLSLLQACCCVLLFLHCFLIVFFVLLALWTSDIYNCVPPMSTIWTPFWTVLGFTFDDSSSTYYNCLYFISRFFFVIVFTIGIMSFSKEFSHKHQEDDKDCMCLSPSILIVSLQIPHFCSFLQALQAARRTWKQTEL